jgi:hypothetical protein
VPTFGPARPIIGPRDWSVCLPMSRYDMRAMSRFPSKMSKILARAAIPTEIPDYGKYDDRCRRCSQEPAVNRPGRLITPLSSANKAGGLTRPRPAFPISSALRAHFPPVVCGTGAPFRSITHALKSGERRNSLHSLRKNLVENFRSAPNSTS